MSYLLIFILFIWVIGLSIKLGELSNKLDDVSNSLSKQINRLYFSRNNLAHPMKEAKAPEENVTTETNDSDQFVDEIPYSVTGQTANSSTTSENEDITISNREYTSEEEKKPFVSMQYKSSYNKEAEEKSFEQVFFGNIYAIVGALAVILGFGFFATMIASALTPAAKIIIGFIAGIAIIILGLSQKKASLKQFSEVLVGTGYSVLFITTYCAVLLTQTFSATAGIVIAGIILIASYITADRQKTMSMIAIALFGGYLNIMLIWADLSFSFLFTYLIFLNILSIIFVIRNQDKDSINIINLFLTLCISIIYISINNNVIKDFDIFYPSFLCIAYLAYDIYLRLTKDSYDSNGILNWLNYAVITILSVFIFKYDRLEIGLFQLLTASTNAISACIFIAKSSDKFRIYLRIMLLSIFMVITFTTENTLRVGILALGTIILSCISSTYNRQYLAKWALGYHCASIIFIFLLNKDMYYVFDTYNPVMNMRTLSFIAPILAGFVGSSILTNMKDIHCKNMAELMKFSCISLVYIIITLEIGDFIRYSNSQDNSVFFISCMTYSIIGLVYSLQMKKMRQITENPIYTIPAVLFGAGSIVLLLTTGYNYVPAESFIPMVNLRFTAYLIAIGYSLYMAKSSKEDEANIFKYLAVFLGFVLLTVETKDYIDSLNNQDLNYLISIVWIVYAAIITSIGLINNIKYLKVSGAGITTLALIKIIFIDMANVDLMLRMFVFIFFGIVLLVISWYYNSHQN